MPKSANLLPFTGPVLAEFYHGTWDIIPVFEVLTPVRTAWVASAEEASLQEDYVALRITGAVELPRAGMCAIALGSSGQSQLLIDGAVVTVNRGLPPEMNTVSDAVSLTAGRHEIILIYLSNTHPPRVTLSIAEPLPLMLDRTHWLYFGCEGDWPKSWSFMSGALAPGRRLPPITYYVRLDGVEHAPDETAPDRRTRIGWTLDEGDLPAPVSTWRAGPLEICIRHVAARLSEDNATAVFTRVSLSNPGPCAQQPSLCVSAPAEYEIPLTRPPDHEQDGIQSFDMPLPAGETVHLDFAALACGVASPEQLKSAGGFETVRERTRAAFRRRAARLALPVELPDPEMAVMFRALQFTTQISTVRTAGGDWEIRGSANSPGVIVQYDRTFSHDVPNIVEQLLFEGDFANARAVMESDYYQRLGRELEQDYLDAIPKYLMPYATYLMHTGDTAYFTESRRADLRRIARRIHEYRLPQMTPEARDRGLYGLMNPSNTMDNGQDFLLVDNLAALHGLVAYCCLAGRLGEAGEASWAKAELDDLNTCLNEALRAGICRRGKPWFHVMMEVEEHALLDQPANWLASSLMMAAFPWGAWLKGFEPQGAWGEFFDASVGQALEVTRRHGCAPGGWGAFWKCKYGSTYNAALGLNLLHSGTYRTLPIANLRWLLDNQSAPFQWGENFRPPMVPDDWTTPCTDYESWGLCFSRQALLHSCIAVHADGRVLIARGIPDDWLRPGCRIAWTRVPVTGGRRIGFSLCAGDGWLTLELDEDLPEGPIVLQPPLLIGNIAEVTADVPVTVDEAAGTVTAQPACRRLCIRLRHCTAPPGKGES